MLIVESQCKSLRRKDRQVAVSEGATTTCREHLAPLPTYPVFVSHEHHEWYMGKVVIYHSHPSTWMSILENWRMESRKSRRTQEPSSYPCRRSEPPDPLKHAWTATRLGLRQASVDKHNYGFFLISTFQILHGFFRWPTIQKHARKESLKYIV